MEGDRTALFSSMSDVQRRIERWRERGVDRWRMPEDLWDGAVSLARRHGIAPVARTLRLDYGSLKKRVARRPGSGRVAAEPVNSFVEIDPRRLVPDGAPGGAVVELLDVAGTKLVIRLSSRESLDVPALVEAFRHRRS